MRDHAADVTTVECEGVRKEVSYIQGDTHAAKNTLT